MDERVYKVCDKSLLLLDTAAAECVRVGFYQIQQLMSVEVMIAYIIILHKYLSIMTAVI